MSTRLGVRLVETAIRFAEQHVDVSRLTLGVHENNTRALAFYRRIGFRMTDKVIPYRLNLAERCYIMECGDFKQELSVVAESTSRQSGAPAAGRIW